MRDSKFIKARPKSKIFVNDFKFGWFTIRLRGKRVAEPVGVSISRDLIHVHRRSGGKSDQNGRTGLLRLRISHSLDADRKTAQPTTTTANHHRLKTLDLKTPSFFLFLFFFLKYFFLFYLFWYSAWEVGGVGATVSAGQHVHTSPHFHRAHTRKRLIRR